MSPREPRIGQAPDAVFIGHDAAVVGIRRERVAALSHEIERPLPLVVVQIPVGPGAAHFLQQRVGHKAAAQGDRHQMLNQYIQRLVWRGAGLHLS